MHENVGHVHSVHTIEYDPAATEYNLNFKELRNACTIYLIEFKVTGIPTTPHAIVVEQNTRNPEGRSAQFQTQDLDGEDRYVSLGQQFGSQWWDQSKFPVILTPQSADPKPLRQLKLKPLKDDTGANLVFAKASFKFLIEYLGEPDSRDDRKWQRPLVPTAHNRTGFTHNQTANYP